KPQPVRAEFLPSTRNNSEPSTSEKELEPRATIRILPSPRRISRSHNVRNSSRTIRRAPRIRSSLHPPSRPRPRRTLYFLIVAAYFNGGQCGNTDCPYVVGGPNWIKNDQFQIDAKVPESYSLFTMRQVRDGKAPYVQQMLQVLLRDRFGLRFHR